MISEQRLLVEAHRRFFPAARRSHSCGWNWSILYGTYSRAERLHTTLPLFFVNKRESVGLRTTSEAFATCVAEVSSAWVRPKVLVWGDNGLPHDSVEMFDPISNTWDNPPLVQESLGEAASAVIVRLRWSLRRPRRTRNVTRLFRHITGHLAGFTADVTGTQKSRCCRHWRSSVSVVIIHSSPPKSWIR